MFQYSEIGPCQFVKDFYFYCGNNFAIMVKWKDFWLEAEDSNGVRSNLWLRKDDEYHGYFKLCSCQVKFNTQGVQAFTQHSQKKKHKGISDIKVSTSQVHISGKAESSTFTEMKKSTSKTMILDASQKDEIVLLRLCGCSKLQSRTIP